MAKPVAFSALTNIYDEGVFKGSVRDINFVGLGVQASIDGNGGAEINVSGSASVSATAGEAIEDGRIVYISGQSEVSKSDNTDTATMFPIGVADGAVASGASILVAINGVQLVAMDAGLTLSPGDVIYLSTNGNGTNVAPSVAGEALVVIGKLFDSTAYAPLNLFASVLLEIEEPTVIS